MIKGIKIERKNDVVKSLKFILPTSYEISSALKQYNKHDTLVPHHFAKMEYTNTAGNRRECLVPKTNLPILLDRREDEKVYVQCVIINNEDNDDQSEQCRNIEVGLFNLKDEHEKNLYHFIINTVNDLSNDLQFELLGIFFDYYENRNKNYNIAKFKISSENGHPLLDKLATLFTAASVTTKALKKKKNQKTNKKYICSVTTLDDILKNVEINLYQFDHVDFSEFYGAKLYANLSQKLTYLTFHLLLLKRIESNNMESKDNEIHSSTHQYE